MKPLSVCQKACVTLVTAAPMLISTAVFAQDKADSHNPTRDRQPSALKDAEEMRKPGVRTDGTGEPAQGASALSMSEPMKLRCKMLMSMKVSTYAPAGVLALRKELNLSPEQVERLKKILDEADSESRSVLNEHQKDKLSGVTNTPDTAMKMHRKMMRRQTERKKGTTEQDTRKDGRSARRSEERPRHRCPMMQAMRSMSARETSNNKSQTTGTEQEGVQRTVDVVLRDFSIDMPQRLPYGVVQLRIRNAGKVDHNLEVEGQGVEDELPQNLKPGESATMHVHLRPGKYEVYCPVANHAERGMRMQLTVTGPEKDD